MVTDFKRGLVTNKFRVLGLLALVIFAGTPYTVLAKDGALSDLEESYESSESAETDSDSDGVGSLVSELALSAGGALADPFVPDRGRLFQVPPYRSPDRPPWSSYSQKIRRAGYRSFSTRTQVTYHHVSEDLAGRGIDGVIRYNAGYSFRGSITRYTERLSGNGEDHLTHWDAHLSIDLSISKRSCYHQGPVVPVSTGRTSGRAAPPSEWVSSGCPGPP